MPLVEYVHDRHHIHSRAFGICRVHVVADGDKADVIHREDIIGVLTYFNVVSSETAEVFNDDHVDPAVLGILKEPLHLGALKARARPTVIDISIYNVEAVIESVLFEYSPLVFDGQRFTCSLIILG